MNRRYVLAGVLIATVVLTLAAWLLFFRGETVGDTVEVTRGDLNVTVETAGRVGVLDLVVLQSPATTVIELVAVMPGDEVLAGDILIRLDPEPFQALIEAAEDALFQAEVALSMMDDTANGADPVTVAERIAAQEQVREAEAQLAEAQDALSGSLVLAPIDGTIISVAATEGAEIGQNAELLQIAGLEEFELELNIDEVDLPLIDRGAMTQVVLEAYPEHEITSEIFSIARRAELVAGTTVFPATVRFPAQEGLTILPGMNAQARITTQVRENVLVLPEPALVTVGRRTFVDVVVNGEVERREIRTGIRGQGMVEVADGLEEGDIVARP